jgi:type IV pilus assembly protein PilA
LVELMTVVAIVGILATLAVYGTRRYILAAKSSEATHMIGSIKAAEESYRDETFSYLNVTGSLTQYYPATPAKIVTQWGGAGPGLANWQTLGVTTSTPVQFGYSCTAGLANTNIDNPGADITITNWPTLSAQPWYVVRAAADRDGNGVYAVFVSASFSGDIFQNDKPFE